MARNPKRTVREAKQKSPSILPVHARSHLEADQVWIILRTTSWESSQPPQTAKLIGTQTQKITPTLTLRKNVLQIPITRRPSSQLSMPATELSKISPKLIPPKKTPQKPIQAPPKYIGVTIFNPRHNLRLVWWLQQSPDAKINHQSLNKVCNKILMTSKVQSSRFSTLLRVQRIRGPTYRRLKVWTSLETSS